MKRKIKITFNAPVVLGFAAICFIATLLNYLTNGKSNQMIFMTYHSSLMSPLTYLRLFTHVFGHDGWQHFIGNMAYILLLGPMLEEKHGPMKIIEVIAVTALVTGVINYVFFWNTALCGASGVVFAFILMASFTSCEIPLPANVQKETFNTLVTETLGDDCNYETVKNIHDNLNEIIDEHKAVSSAPVMLDKTEVKEILEKSGVKEEKLADFEEHFEMAAGENGKLAANNITPSRKFEVKTPDVVIKINPDKTDLVETRVIDGKQCLVIQIDEHLEVNGISVNPDTGEVIDRNENTNNNIY